MLKSQLHISSIRQLETVQHGPSSITQDINVIHAKRPTQTEGQVNPSADSVPSSSPPKKLRLATGRPVVARLANLCKALESKAAQIKSTSGNDLSLAEVIEEIASDWKIKYVQDLSRLSSLYGTEEVSAALEKTQALLSIHKSKHSPVDSLQRNFLEGIDVGSPPEDLSVEQQKLKSTEAQIYTQLLKLKGNTKLDQDRQNRLKQSEEKHVSDEKVAATVSKIRKIAGDYKTPPKVQVRDNKPPPSIQVPVFTESLLSPALVPETHAPKEKSPAQRDQPPINAQVVDTGFIAQRPVDTEDKLNVPTLSFDLSRVLFNPGVYHLQDPRSRVFNFDPYLQNITPVDEFNWGALNPYITSSQDHFLRDVAIKQKKRYIGSSSSMSGAMSQFHFLLSAWRPLDFSNLSKKMDGLTSFTQITRAPASVFLRHRNGVYAVDADKEHDAPNILMMHGKSMEKLLTLEKEEFEKYKLPKDGEDAPTIDVKPESYHYSTLENFLLRSQLDAYDPRLPGTGMFDLKTRAVAGIRMYLSNHESGMTYEIKDRFGLWESYEREYYDMIRSAFLKYSLQVRMGRMDGIFVAYHNIARIFGFQYIPISELDQALHGQADPTVGNREFRMSIKLLSEVFDRATKACPGQSLRFIFETYEPPKGSENAPIFMRIFAEVMTEEEIEAVQAAGKEKVEDYEDSMARGIDPKEEAKAAKQQQLEDKISIKATASTLDSTLADSTFLDSIFGKTIDSALQPKPQPEPEVKELEPLANQKEESERTVLCWKLKIYNEVNGHIVDRPERITTNDRWNVHYTIEQETKGVQSSYNAAKNKRRSMFTFNEEEDASRAWFQKSIIRLNESGRKWRAKQNELDAEKEKVVLYTKSSASGSK